MRDIFDVAYIIMWVVLVRVTNRTPIWQPRTFQVGDVSYHPDLRPMGCMMALFLVVGGGVGATLPQAFSDMLPPPIPHVSPDPGLDSLGRLSQLVGGLSGAYVGLRGSWLWCLLIVVGVSLYLLHAAVAYVLPGL